MANTKITSLTELNTTPADTDMLVIVDVSDTTMNATGTNKKVAADMFMRTNGTALNFAAGDLEAYGDLSLNESYATLDLNATTGNPRLYYSTNGTTVWQNFYNLSSTRFEFIEVGVGTHLTLKNGGNVGVGNTSPSYSLDVNGQAHASSFPTSSDARLKDIIGTLNLTPALKQKLNSINAYLFTWKDNYSAVDEFKRQDGQTKDIQVGFIAQEVEAAIPQLVTHWRHEGKDGEVLEDALAVDYTRFVPILWEAVKELYSENADLRQRVSVLEASNIP